MNVNKLKGKMVEKEKNIDWLAGVLDCDKSTAYRKINTFEKLTIGDASKIKKGLELSEAEALEIFL